MRRGTLQRRIGGLKVCGPCSNFEVECVPYLHLLNKQRYHFRPNELTLAPHSIMLYQNFAELQASAHRGCDICRIWHKALLNECHSSTDELALLDSPEPVLLEPPRYFKPSSDREYDINISSPIQTSVRWMERWLDGPWDAKIAHDPRIGTIWDDAAEWLEDCMAAHESCKLQVGERSLPRRLVHIPDALVARVCETSGLAEDVPYAALSYAWGGDQAIKLTAEQEPGLKDGVSQIKFPRTIRDTFDACRLLGISYVWIDALCIRQDDGGIDFQRESERMDKIYGLAKVTLIITSAETAQEGFLMPRTLETYTIDPKRMDFADGKLMIKRKGINETRARSPLASRGWCFQEELLSTRVIYCSNHGVFWSCPKSNWAEHGNADGDFDEQHGMPVTVLGPHFLITSPDRLHIWDRLVEQYSARNLSFPEDRLPAVRGLAASIEIQTGEEFSFGMWKSRLPVQLLWITLEFATTVTRFNESRRVAVEEQIPSWSWVSTPPTQAVRMPGPEISYARAKLLDVYSIDHSSCLLLQGRKRPLLAGHTRLEAWPVKGRIKNGMTRDFEETDRDSLLWAATEDEVYIREDGREPVVIQLDRSLSVAMEDLVCFEINYKGLLLLEAYTSDRYRRVGCSQLHGDAAFFAHSDVAKIELI